MSVLHKFVGLVVFFIILIYIISLLFNSGQLLFAFKFRRVEFEARSRRR